MPTREVCENDYDKAFEVIVGGERHTFDSFECAIHALAPVCPHCNCRIVGHGVEADGQVFCCVHCARESGATQLKDCVWGRASLRARGFRFMNGLQGLPALARAYVSTLARSVLTQLAINLIRLDLSATAKYRC